MSDPCEPLQRFHPEPRAGDQSPARGRPTSAREIQIQIQMLGDGVRDWSVGGHGDHEQTSNPADGSLTLAHEPREQRDPGGQYLPSRHRRLPVLRCQAAT